MPSIPTDDLLARPLNVFRIPSSILADLKSEDAASHNNVKEPSAPVEVTKEQETLKGGLFCNACQKELQDANEQRQHYRQDWHRYNVKRRLLDANSAPLTEDQFEALVGDLDNESLSGSDSDCSDDGSSSETDSVTALLRKQNLEDGIDRSVVKPARSSQSAYAWFKTVSEYPPNVSFGVLRNIFPPNGQDENDHMVEKLRSMQIKGNPNSEKRRGWTILMVGGGHFAGIVVDVDKSHPQSTGGDRSVSVLAHKSFHRYTTRRKQGGAQSANDSHKGAANSAGAQIRRYNESMLQQEIRELLSQWGSWIRQSELIFVHAPGNNRKVIYHYEGAILSRADPRIRSFPFNTRRPTINELKRAFYELTILKVSHIDPTEYQAMAQRAKEETGQERKQASPSPISPPTKPVSTETKPTVPEEIEKLVTLVQKGKLDLILKHAERSDINLVSELPNGLKAADATRFPTLLHIAASSGQPDIVQYLLNTANANPTIVADNGKTPYEVAKDKETRNAFRRSMAAYPNLWDWMGAAKVPSALTQEMEAEQRRREDEKRKKEKERKKKTESEKKAREQSKVSAAEEKANEFIGKTPGKHNAAITADQIDLSRLTPEMRAKVERERRARAIEAMWAKRKT
ncbi:hypothetical protein BZG36_01013 [Bifiguratus adelaidae]|uniref:VLRF1 domain-containing protein n=1 Tax=Bifiguratus adelaidae TaxID=1938954 RepID=A0A261Y659_9FUNG|nr:hypothetical protein BZG36_01013 [Bifiguratus adelaidae]